MCLKNPWNSCENCSKRYDESVSWNGEDEDEGNNDDNYGAGVHDYGDDDADVD